MSFNKADSNRIFGLDILRAAAILFVLLSHSFPYAPQSFVTALSPYNLNGVSMFFVLSGFLIGGILIRALERDGATMATLLHFWIRRWFRTLPNYFLILLVLSVLCYQVYDRNFLTTEYVLFLQNFNKPSPPFFSEAWSLCVEEWFYFLVPLVLFFLVGNLRMSVRSALILVAVTLIAASTVARYDTYAAGWIQTGRDWDSLIRKELISRLDSLMFGLLGAWVLHYHPRVWKKHKNPLFILGLVILALEHKTMALSGLGLYLCVFSLSAVSIGVLFLLPFLSDLKGGNGWMYRTITFISAISYSLYLVNYSLFNLIAILLKRGLNLPPTDKNLFLFFAFWIVAFGLASVLHFFYEMPMMRLRERFPLRAKSPPTRPSPPPRTRPHSPTDAPHGPGIP